MRLSEVVQGQQSWAAFLNGPIQEAYRDVLNSEIARLEYDAKSRAQDKGKGKKKKKKQKTPSTDCAAGCSKGTGTPDEASRTDCAAGCSATGKRTPKKSTAQPKPHKRKAQGWFTKPV
jgi:hypothetical protein